MHFSDLCSHKVKVHTLLCHECLVIANLCNMASTQDSNGVRISDGGQAVGNYNGRTTLTSLHVVTNADMLMAMNTIKTHS